MEAHAHIPWPPAPAWSQAVGICGRSLTLLALGLFVASAAFWLLSPTGERWRKYGARAFVWGLWSLVGVFVALGTLFVTDQFYYRYVFSHSDTSTELWYKIAAIWSGQEGSFLLWALCSALFGVWAARSTGAYRRWFTITYALFLASLSAILAYESPFATETIDGRLLLPPEGMGLQPSLLNYWVTIHPPTIFLGFGALTVLFAWSLAALIGRDLTSWIKPVRPWAILAATILGIGLCMGGFWAYETLGWGGFWAWDPVENTSFVPWVACVAFIHGIFVQLARGKWAATNALLAALPFLLFAYGTFLTRSGFLAESSVHSFAQMNRTALWLLIGVLVAGVVAFTALWLPRALVRTPKTDANSVHPGRGFDKEAFYAAGIWLLLALGVATAVGMSVPFIMALTHRPTRVVEESMYHQVLVWFFVPLVLVMAIAPLLTWRKIGLRQLLNRISNCAAITIGLVGFALIWIKNPRYGVGLDETATIAFPLGYRVALLPWLACLIGACVFAIVCSLWRMAELWPRAKGSIGGLITHVGVVLTMTGLIVSRGFERDEITRVEPGRSGAALDRIIALKRVEGDLFDRDTKVIFDVIGKDDRFVARPGLYFKPQMQGEPTPVVWPYIERRVTHDWYVAIGPLSTEASDPLEFLPGETKNMGNISVTYKGINRQGEPGVPGTKFIADLVVTAGQKTLPASPMMVLRDAGPPDFVPAKLDSRIGIGLVRMDAGSKSVTLQLQFAQPGFPVHLLYKPMTILVWIGAIVMTAGGLMSTWYRRRFQRPERDLADAEPTQPHPALEPTSRPDPVGAAR